ncbi:hypothetical protein PGB90_003413 [Kerria lacca]
MFFLIRELSPWLGMTKFELLVQTICLMLFTVILALHIDEINKLNPRDVTIVWWTFSSLFAANIINAYFCVIVFIRTCVKGPVKEAIVRAMWSATVIGILMLFEYMLCQKVIGNSSLDMSEIVSPILLLLQLLAVRACQMQ